MHTYTDFCSTQTLLVPWMRQGQEHCPQWSKTGGHFPVPCPIGEGVKVRAVTLCCPQNKACLTTAGRAPGSISKALLELDNLSIHLSKCLQFPFQGRWSNNKFVKKVNLCPKHFSKLKRLGGGLAGRGMYPVLANSYLTYCLLNKSSLVLCFWME